MGPHAEEPRLDDPPHPPGVAGAKTTRMKRAIADLTDFSDDRLFKEVAEGVARITENATSLDESAARLHQAADFRASKIMQGFSEEEAAKVLILIDFIRCPAIPERRAQTLKHYYGHVAKRIYAMACTYPRIATFGELCNLVSVCQKTPTPARNLRRTATLSARFRPRHRPHRRH